MDGRLKGACGGCERYYLPPAVPPTAFPVAGLLWPEADCFCIPQAAGKIHVSEGGLGHQPYGQLGLF